MPGRRSLHFVFHMDQTVKYAVGGIVTAAVGYFVSKWLSNDDVEDKRGKTKRRKQVPGLVNVGNSCFMNSILQCLASCPAFLAWLKEFVASTKNDGKHVYMADVLLKILEILAGEEDYQHEYYDPSELLVDMSGRGWQIPSDEQDAHEFFHAAMTTLHEEHHHQVDRNMRVLGIFEIKDLLSSPRIQSAITRVNMCSDQCSPKEKQKIHDNSFRGTLGCVLQCQTCGYQNPIRYDGFDSLSLPLPNLSWGSETTLQDCLRNFTAAETIRDVECTKCGSWEAQNVAGDKIQQIPSSKPAPLSCAQKSCNNNIIPSKTTNDTMVREANDMVREGEATCCGDLGESRSDQKQHMNTKYKTETRPEDLNNFQSNWSRNTAEKVQEPCPIPLKRTFIRKISIGKLPDCVCIHLQRLVWTMGCPVKKVNFVQFPEILDMGPFTEITRLSRTCYRTSSSEVAKDAERTKASADLGKLREMQEILKQRKESRNGEHGIKSVISPSPSLLGGSTLAAGSSGPSQMKALYRLMSVLVHIGDWSFSGHFLAYRRILEVNDDGEKTSRWICTSDTMVRKATKNEVFSCPAYMLFYERIKA